MKKLRRVLEILIFISAITFIAMFISNLEMYTVNAKGVVRSVEDHSKDYELPRFIKYEDFVNDPFLLCTGMGIHIPGYSEATVISGSYSTHTTDQGKDTGELTSSDIGSATVFNDGSYKGLTATTSKTYGYYTEATHRSATPAEVYVLAELNDNTPGNGAEFKVTDTEYTGTVQEEAYVVIDGVKYYTVEYNEAGEATKYVAKVGDKYYEVEVTNTEGMGNYSAVQVAWWAVSPAQEGGHAEDNSLAKEAREFEKYIDALSSGGKWHYSDEEATECTGMTLNKTELIMYADDTAQLLLSMEPTNLEKKEITWTTSDKEIATVNERGVVKALKKGKIRITVALKENPEMKAECIVIVKKPVKVAGIKLDKTTLTIKVDESAELKASLEPADATSQVTWSTSNKEIATVENGKITGVKKGTATITAKAGGKKATCKVTVKEKETTPSDDDTATDDDDDDDDDSGDSDSDDDDDDDDDDDSGSSNPIYQYSVSGKVIKSYKDDTINVSVEKIDKYYVTKIWVKDPSKQVKKAEAGWRKEVKTVDTMLDGISGAIVGCNGSGFLTSSFPANGSSDSGGLIRKYESSSKWKFTTEGYIVLTNGEVRRNFGESNAMLGILPNGSFKYYEKSKYEDVVADGVKNTFTFGPLIINNGKAYKQQVGKSRKSLTEVRKATVVGQVDENNFVIITTIDKGKLNNITELGLKLNCKLLYNFDGGGSRTLWFRNGSSGDGKSIIGGGRKVGDALYFTTGKK